MLMKLYKLKCKLGFCVAEGCIKKGINHIESEDKDGKLTFKICKEHTPHFIKFIEEENLEKVNIIYK